MERKKRIIKVSVVTLALSGVILLGGYSLIKDKKTKGHASGLTFERTPARLERGRYIVEGPAHCFQCHSDVDSPAHEQNPD